MKTEKPFLTALVTLMFVACSSEEPKKAKDWESPNFVQMEDGMGKEVKVLLVANITSEDVFDRLIEKATYMNPCEHSGSWVPKTTYLSRTGAGNWRVAIKGLCANAFNVSDDVNTTQFFDSAFVIIADSTHTY